LIITDELSKRPPYQLSKGYINITIRINKLNKYGGCVAKLNVTLLNFHGIVTHIEVLIVNPIDNTFYIINRWGYAQNKFEPIQPNFNYQNLASSIFQFNIDADPQKIAAGWKNNCKTPGDIFTNNCADAVEWFLYEFANIPKTTIFKGPLQINHLALGIPIPNIIPIGVNLPGRVMDNAKWHLDNKAKTSCGGLFSKQNAIGALTAVSVAASAMSYKMK
jgi:hypothetical protein